MTAPENATSAHLRDRFHTHEFFTRMRHAQSGCHGSELRGWTGELQKLGDGNILYKTRFEGEATVGDVRVVDEEGDGGLWNSGSL